MATHGADEGGFTIIEVLVAILILAVASMTTFTLLSAATRNTQRAKASQVALEYAEQELEFLRSKQNKELALKVAPPHSAEEANPDFRVSKGEFALTRKPLGNYRELVVNEGSLYGGGEVKGGTINPGPEPFTSGDVTGHVYRYVVWHNDESCSEIQCPGKQDYKQIVVVVKLDKVPTQSAETGYTEVQSNFIDPTDNAENDPLPNAEGKVVTAQQFYLTDTPCSATNSTERQEITEDHLLHNTRGTCASGPQTGTTNGAPDALLLGSPPDPAPEDPNNPPLYDYSSDTYLEPKLEPGSDKGLQIKEDESGNCNFVPTATTHPESRIHLWVTDPMAEKFIMTEKVTLEFYTRALGDALYNGEVCVYLFKRRESGSTVTDTRLENTNGSTLYWTYAPAKGEYWPRFKWEKVRLTMTFKGSPYPVEKEERLGLGLSVERNNTSGEEGVIPIMYDNPGYASRLEVDTTTPISGG